MTTDIGGVTGWTSADPADIALAVTTLANSIGGASGTRQIKTYKAADLTALAAIVGGANGDMATVQELAATFIHNGTTWTQATPARFATAGARDTAYAKASGAYKTNFAEVQRTDQNWTERYFIGTGPLVSGWYPVSGRFPYYSLSLVSGSIANTTEVTADITTDELYNSSVFTAASDVITIVQPGRYDLSARAYWTGNNTGSRGTWITKNGTATANAVAGGDQRAASGTSGASVGGVVRLLAGDTIRVILYQSSGAALVVTGGNFNIAYLGP